MLKNGLTIAQMAELRGCSVQAAYSAKSKGQIEVDDESGLCDPTSEKNALWIRKRPHAGAPRSQQAAPQGSGSLDDQKLQADISLKQRQARKLDRQHAEAMAELIPKEVASAWLGTYGSGARIHLLELPGRLAPKLHAAVQSGSTVEEIRDMIASEVKDGLERALAMGETATHEVVRRREEEEAEEAEEGADDES